MEVLGFILNHDDFDNRCWTCHKTFVPGKRKPNMIVQRVMLEEQKMSCP